MKMINLKKYFRKDAAIGDICTTTNIGLLPRIIYSQTWKRKNRKFLRYSQRAHLGTHVAIVIKYQGKWCFVEMDATKTQPRYVSKKNKCILTPEEYKQVKHAIGKNCERYSIISGVKITPWRKYNPDNIYSPHICFIGRHPGVKEFEKEINKWYIDKYRYGVPYDFPDLFTFLKWNKKVGIVGRKSNYICSELPEAALKAFCIRTRDYSKPWSPMEWQTDKELITVAEMI